MNWDQVEGKWKQFTGSARERWGKLTDDDWKTVGGKKDIAILEVHPIGNYAVRLVFDDMHSTGIYSWDYLYELGRNHAQIWQDYLDALAEKGLSR